MADRLSYIGVYHLAISVCAKFRGIASEGTRRNVCGFNFRGARTHRGVRCHIYIHITLVAIFMVYILAEADLSAKITKFCTTQKFPLTVYAKLSGTTLYIKTPYNITQKQLTLFPRIQ